MKRFLSPEGLLLVGLNLIVFVVFLLVYRPVPEGYEGVARFRKGQLVFEINSANPELFAARELHWHSGEPLAARLYSWANLPAWLGMAGVAIATNGLTYRLSAITQSWIHAGIFLVLMPIQWLLIGWAVSVLRGRFVHQPSVA